MQLFLHKRDEPIVEHLVWREIIWCFSGTVIEVIDGLFHLLPRDLPEIRLLREELSKESIGIFIDASLP